MIIEFFVSGNPVPKQSYRAVKGGGYTDPRVKDWQHTVAECAAIEMMGKDMLTCSISIRLQFFLNDKRRKDWDNLAKGVMDGLNGIVYKDDSQVTTAYVEKNYYKAMPGVYIMIEKDGRE